MSILSIVRWSAFALACLALPAAAQPVPLGATSTFAILGATTVTNAGPTIVSGDVGVAPGTAITGFPPGSIVAGTGTLHPGDAVASQARNDFGIAYANLAARTCQVTVTADLGGQVLTPGVYCSPTTMTLSGILTLDAQGDPNALFIFQMGTTITTAVNSRVQVINSAQTCNVFWQVGSSATIGIGTSFAGSLLAAVSITLSPGVSASGRAMAGAAVTMDTNAFSVCALAAAVPTLGKAFLPATVNAGSVSTLVITLSNPDPTLATLTADLVDTLPSGVVIAAVPNVATTCGGVGAPVAVAGASTVTLPTGRSIPGNGSCTLSVDVTAATGGSYVNTLAAGALATSNGNNQAPAVATLTVVALVIPPALGKAFVPASVTAGGVSTLTITLSNPDPAVATLTAPLVDSLPAGVVIAATPNAASTCGGAGAVVAVAGGSSVTLPAGRTIPAAGSCTLTVDVTGAVGGSYINTLAAGALATSNGNNQGPAVATLTIVAIVLPPTLGKAFTLATINAGGTSTLTITLSNPDATVAVLSAPLTDTLPAGVVIAATPNLGTTCGGAGAPTATPGGSTVSLPAGRTIPAIGSCTLTVDVTAAAGGSYVNTLPPGALATSNGSNSGAAVATLTVVALVLPPTLGKAFTPATVNAGSVSTLTLTLSNPDPAAATLTAPLTDTLPGGLMIAFAPNASTTCGGAGAVVAVAGSSTLTLPAGRSIPAASSCTVTVDVTAAVGGSYVNTLAAGALATTNGSNAQPAVATLTVLALVSPPVLGKAFIPPTVNAGAVSTLSITLSNPDPAAATLTAPLSDTLPAGLLVAATPNATTTCGGAGAIVAVAGGSTITLPAGRILPSNGSCTVDVDVSAAAGGSYVNTLPAGALATTNGSNAGPAIATLTVVALVLPPTLGKAFLPATVNAGAVSTLTITLTNPDATVATLTAALVDTLPAGLVVAPTPAVATTCGGAGAPVAVAGGSTVTLPAGRTIPANGNCTLTVDVTAAIGGSYINVLPAGALMTGNGNNAGPAIATLTVVALVLPPTLGKAFAPATVNAGTVSTLTITLTNPDATLATLTAALVDNLPAGVVVAAAPNAATTCGGAGALVATAGSAAVTLPAGRTIPANGSCTVTVDVTAASGGTYINTLATGSLATSNGSNAGPAIATLTVVALVLPPSLGKAFTPATITAGGVSTLTLTLSNADATPATLTAPLVDNLPAGVVIAAAPNAATTCGGAGAPIAVAGAASATLPAGRIIPANASCTFSVDVTASAGGSYINTLLAGALATSNGSNAGPAIATLTVVAPVLPPTLAKSFAPAAVAAGAVSTLTIVLANPDPAVATLTAALTDTLPAGLVVAAVPNVGSNCGGAGAPVAIAGGSTVTLPAGRTIPANGNCTLSVDVTAAVGGAYLNTLAAGTLATSNGSNAAPAAATLTVAAVIVLPPTLAKAFGPAAIGAGGISVLAITLGNPDATVATLTAPLVDPLPAGVLIAAIPNALTTCGGAGAPVALAGSGVVSLPAGRTIPANGSCTLSVNVTAAAGGVYLNNLAAGALATSNGSNAAPAAATLTVAAAVLAPTLAKGFAPASIFAGGTATLVITLGNPDPAAAILTAPLVDSLPAGLVVAAVPNVASTCGGVGAPIAVPGSSSVTLPAGRIIPANGSCTLSVDVSAAAPGAMVNMLPAGALATTNGSNAATAAAGLTVLPAVIPPAGPAAIRQVPTLSEWAMLLLIAGFALSGFLSLRRRLD